MLLVSITEVPEEFRDKFLELRKLLKEKYGINILSEEMGAVLDVFESTFKPLITAYQKDEIEGDDIAVKLQEYSERLNLLSSVVKYAVDRYGIDFREAALFKVLNYNLEGVSKHLQEMNHEGKSLEEAYRYMLSQAIVIMDGGNRIQ